MAAVLAAIESTDLARNDGCGPLRTQGRGTVLPKTATFVAAFLNLLGDCAHMIVGANHTLKGVEGGGECANIECESALSPHDDHPCVKGFSKWCAHTLMRGNSWDGGVLEACFEVHTRDTREVHTRMVHTRGRPRRVRDRCA